MTLTPEQFNLLVTKNEFSKLKERVDKMDGKIDSIITTLDGITKSFKDHKEDHDMNQAAHDRFEKRITKLEIKVGIPAIDIE